VTGRTRTDVSRFTAGRLNPLSYSHHERSRQESNLHRLSPALFSKQVRQATVRLYSPESLGRVELPSPASQAGALSGLSYKDERRSRQESNLQPRI
jgi:hypothetical protein